jgi:hypothetical protein
MKGGKRTGAGRKRNDPPTKAHCLSITEEQAKLLRRWGKGDMSAGLRWLIDMGLLLIIPPRPPGVPSPDSRPPRA